MAKKEHLTAEQIEAEIKRLAASPHVKLAKKEANLKNKRKQRLYQLRWLERRGKELSEKGITLENITEEIYAAENLSKEKTNV